MKHQQTAVEAQLDLLLQAVTEHTLAAWSRERMTAAMAVFGQASPTSIEQAVTRLIARELRTLQAARGVQAAALGAAIAQARAEAAGSESGHD